MAQNPVGGNLQLEARDLRRTEVDCDNPRRFPAQHGQDVISG